MNLHFISGLPRSGSTLLAALLRQNSRVHASISSPLAKVYTDVHAALGLVNEASDFIHFEQRYDVLKGLFLNFYERGYFHIDGIETVFDTSREWTARHLELFELFPQSKMIVLVRSVPEILNSFERIYQKNLFTSSKVWGTGTNASNRADAMMADGGVVQRPYLNAKDIYTTGDKQRILFVTYDTLVHDTTIIMDIICKFLGMDYVVDRELEQIPGVEAFDHRLGVSGLHHIGKEVARNEYGLLIPQDILKKYSVSHPAFWHDRMPGGMTVI